MSPPFVGSSAYSASKAAAYSLSTAMRLEFSSFKIKVVTVNPTFHGTPLVHSMREKVYKAYSRLPKSKQLEYGEGRCHFTVQYGMIFVIRDNRHLIRHVQNMWRV